MIQIHRLLTALALTLILGHAAAEKIQLAAVDKATLQASMQQHIDRQLVEGAYLHLNPDTGEVTPLHPTTAHPMILSMGKYYVLCSDFRDARGSAVNIDFYLARRGRNYVVFHTAVAQRAQLERLMKAGKVEMLD